jgi:hypothetical protein
MSVWTTKLDPPRPCYLLQLGLVFVWISLLAAALLVPYLGESGSQVERLTRYPVRVSLLYYAAAATLMLMLRPEDCLASSTRGRIARLCWTLAWGAFIVHLATAFQFYHHWSHADAVAHTQAVSGFGPGIYFSHFFTVVWTADVLVWWLWPARYARRSHWIDRLLHGYMVFMIFNATIIYEQGFIRWAGIGLFTEIAAVAAYRGLADNSHRAHRSDF